MFKQGGVILTLLGIIFRRPAALVGAIMFALLFPILLLSVFIDLQGGIENPYFSLFIYLILGPLSILALVLLAVGLIRVNRQGLGEHYTYEFFKEQLTNPEQSRRIRRLVYNATFFISLFLLFLGVVAYSGHSFTDSSRFCGTFCHTVMEPEYVTFKNSPHSQVSCVACHIEQNAQGVTKAKFTGMKQLYATFFNTYERPLQTPLQSLRPTRQICEQCHRPEKFHGHKLTFIDTFLPDEDNSHMQTTMLLKIGSGGYQGHAPHGIHWHISEQHQLYYQATDAKQQKIIRVELKEADGTSTIYHKQGVTAAERATEYMMDCLDCHNRPTHIFLAPDAALDKKIHAGRIPAELPYIKQQALAAISRPYADAESARLQIARQLRQWYDSHYPELSAAQGPLLEKAISGAQQAYSENVFPEMNIHWQSSYQSYIGHQNDTGCFRCHNGTLVSDDGKVISRDCDLCHVILAENVPAKSITEMMQSIPR
ncbi:MAG: hypothetical protein C0613_04995 [Desulfobulbaceae bacterium]|nr:MAG: hypothetical protein C0613_04995 [Desulfobulbaceae bacterium]